MVIFLSQTESIPKHLEKKEKALTITIHKILLEEK
jgi:hypothetical protein